jgi:WD40 repeat protein/transcriptional regulator with XRE-family HTH domain
MGLEPLFGRRVRERRRTLDLTQEELARRVGCAAITIRKIEMGDMRASQQVAERLVAALGVPLDERAAFVLGLCHAGPQQTEPVVSPRTPAPAPAEIGAADLSCRAIRGYALGERIGSGGFGAAYRAVQPLVEREVAIKIILPQYADHPDFVRCFEAEAQLVARLEHPYIVPLYNYWREPGVAYLVMRLLRGGPLYDLLQHGPLPLPLTLRLIEQVGAALHAAHRAGVVHRDLKPANILLDSEQNAYLADFGIAKNFARPAEESAFDGGYVGSPAYSSPEQIRAEPVTPQTDIYALGVLLYELLTGQKPFVGETPVAYIKQHLNMAVPPLADRRAGLPNGLDRIIQRATAKVPTARYASVAGLVAEVRSAIGERTGAGQGVVVQRAPAAPPTVVLDLDDTDNPYKGLRPFDEADATMFFGREGLVQQLLSRMGESGELARFLAVIGPSGSGKSSVVRAGLVPALRAGGLPGSEQWYAIDLLPGAQPLEALAAAICRVAPAGVKAEKLCALLRADTRGLLRAARLALPADPAAELLVVIDQFEEIFTLTTDAGVRAHLLDSIVAAVLDEHSQVRVVITLRADFVDRPLRYVDFGELIQQRGELVLPLTPDEIERAVEGPAARAGLVLEDGLVTALIADLDAQPGRLPLLQHTLRELFARRHGRLLTHTAYAEIGGVTGSLARSAEAIYDELEGAARAAARQLFLRLVVPGVGADDTRRRAGRSEMAGLGAAAALEQAITAFGQARLLTFDHDQSTREPTIEVAHEALLREWPRLRGWHQASREGICTQQRLAQAATEWITSGRDPSFLATGTRLVQVREWARGNDEQLNKTERAFLAASVEEAHYDALNREAQHQRELAAAQQLAQEQAQRADEQTHTTAVLRRRARWLTGALVLAVALASVALFFGNQANQNAAVAQQNAAAADMNARHAETEQQTAVARELAAAAVSNLPTDPERSILLALQAIDATRAMRQPTLVEAQDALHRAVQSSHLLSTLRGHTAGIWGLAVNRDGSRLATVSQDGTVKVWDAATGQVLVTFPTNVTNSLNGTGVAFTPDGARLLTISRENTATLWDLAARKAMLTLSGHIAAITSVAISPDGTIFATASNDKTVKLWDAATGKELKTFTGHNGAPRVVAFSPYGKRIVAGGDEDGIAVAWDIATGKELFRFSGQGNLAGIGAIAASPDGTRLATGEFDTTVKVWDAATGGLLLTLFGHSSQVQSVVFSADSKYLASASEDGSTKLWDAVSGKELLTLSGHTSGVLGVAFSPDGNRLFTASRDGTVKVWDISPSAGADWLNLVGHAARITSVTYSPNGTRLATWSSDGTVIIWDSTSGKALRTIHHENAANGGNASYSPDGKRLAIVSGKAAIVYDAESGAALLALAPFQHDAITVLFSPDGTRLAAASIDGVIRIYDSVTGKMRIEFTSATPLSQIAFSPDGKRLASANNPGAHVWDVLTGAKLVTFNGHGDGRLVSGVTFSSDGTRIASVGNDGAVRVWNSETGTEIVALIGHTGSTRGVAFSPDGQYLASSSVDRTIKLWKPLHKGEQVAPPLTFSGHIGAVYSVAFSPNGARLATAGRDPIVQVYTLRVDDLIARAKTRLTRELTNVECQQFLHVAACPADP